MDLYGSLNNFNKPSPVQAEIEGNLPSTMAVNKYPIRLCTKVSKPLRFSAEAEAGAVSTDHIQEDESIHDI